MASPRFSLPPELFGTLFPFHLAFDRNLEVVQVGTVLERICIGLSAGSRLGRHFQINRPNIQVEFDAIREHSRSLFILESRHSALQLKGQMVYVEQPEVMLFLCFPWIIDLTTLGDVGLALNDFPIHDTTADFLFLLQTQNTSLAEAKELTNKLTGQRAELREANRKLAAQYAAARVLAESATLNEATSKILVAICETLDWQLGALWSMDEYASLLRCEQVWNASPGQFAKFESITRLTAFAPGVELPGCVWRSGKPAWVADANTEDNFPRAPCAGEEGLHSGFGFPIESEGKVIGVLEFYSREIRQPDNDLLRMFAVIGSQIGQFAARKRAEKALRDLAEQLEQANAETRTLYEIGQEITAQVGLEPTLCLIVERARDLSQAEACTLALLDEKSGTATIRASSGELTDALVRLRIKAGEGVHGRVIMTATPVVVDDYLQEYRDSPFLRTVEESGMRSQVAVPLTARGAVIGVLSVTSQTPYKFHEEDQQLLTALADQAAIAIDNAKLYEQVRRHAEELEAKVEARTVELQEANRRLEDFSRHKSEFLANMSHELRTPLNAIIGFSQVLVERMFGELNPKQDEYIKDINSSGGHLLSLINDILDLSKIEAGRMELELSRFDLLRAIDNALTLVRGRAVGHAIALDVAVDGRLGEFVGDERKFKQILLNLLSNAVKFTPDGGRVGVRATLANGSVEIAVSDTGIGIPEHEQALIFEEFHQAGSDHPGRHEGTGLGLTLTKKFVELHGGTISVRSEVGRGSTFTFALPVRPWPTP